MSNSVLIQCDINKKKPASLALLLMQLAAFQVEFVVFEVT